MLIIHEKCWTQCALCVHFTPSGIFVHITIFAQKKSGHDPRLLNYRKVTRQEYDAGGKEHINRQNKRSGLQR